MAIESIRVPEVGESVTEGTIATWFAQVGGTISAGEPLFELATEKVDSEIPSPVSGTIVEILIPQGGVVSVGDAVIKIDTEGGSSQEKATNNAAETVNESPAAPAEKSEPPARRARRSKRQAAAASSAAPPLPPMPPGLAVDEPVTLARTVEVGDGDSFQTFSRIRAVTGRIVAESNLTVPHALSLVEADHAGIFRARDAVAARGGRPPTALAFIAVAVARALGEHPVLNSSVGDGGLVLHSQINLSFAVATDDGLVAPVVRNANQLTVSGMADAIVDLARRARSKQLSPDDMTGGTFSISNNGSVGSVLTAPVITPPQVAVLSTDQVVDRAVVLERDGVKSIAIRPVGNLAMSWDHRAMDGADAASFLTRVKEIVETTDWSSVV